MPKPCSCLRHGFALHVVHEKKLKRERRRTVLVEITSQDFNLINFLRKASILVKMSAAQLLNPKAESRVRPSRLFHYFRLLIPHRGVEKLCGSTSTQVKVCKMC